MSPKLPYLKSPGLLGVATFAAFVLTGYMLLHSGRDFTTSGAFNVSPLAIIGGAPCNVTLGTVPRETLEGFFTRLLNGVSDGETNTGAAAAAAAAAEAAQQGASLEQQLQRAEEPLLAALKERGALPGKSEAEKGTALKQGCQLKWWCLAAWPAQATVQASMLYCFSPSAQLLLCLSCRRQQHGSRSS